MTRCRPALALLLLCAASRPAQAAWIANGNPVCTAAGNQTNVRVVRDGAGGMFVAWQDARTDAGDVYVQHLTGAGTIVPGWPLNGRGACTAVGMQFMPVMVPDGAGGVFLAWIDHRGTNTDIYAHHLGPTGAAVAGWPANGLAVCTQPFDQVNATACSDDAGGVYVAWSDWRSGTHVDVYALRLNADGTPGASWPVQGLQLTNTTENKDYLDSVPDGAGGALITWWNQPLAGSGAGDARATRVLANAAIAADWSGGVGIAPGPHDQGRYDGIRALPDQAGGYWFAWTTFDAGTYEHVWLQHLDGHAAPLPGWSSDGLTFDNGSNYSAYAPQIALDGAGQLYVAWTSNGASTPDVYLRKFTSSGAAPPGWEGGVGIAVGLGSEFSPTVAADGAGGILLAWMDRRPDDVNELGNIYASHVTTSGALAPGWLSNGTSIATATGQQRFPLTAPDGFGGALVAWEDDRNGATDVYATRLATDGPTAVEVSVVESRADAFGAHLKWVVSQVARADVERDDGDGWHAVATLVADGRSRLVYDDATPKPGARVGYRLAWQDAEGTHAGGETWLAIPAGALALAPVSQPARGAPAARFTLADDAPATLELLDAQGRRMAAADVGSLGAGPHTWTFAAPAPGLYVIRLSQAGAQRTASVIVTR